MALIDLTARTHPRRSGVTTQLVVLVLAAVVGVALGMVLLLADRSSWSGARTTVATVTGQSDKGVLADASGKEVVLHVAPLPRVGTTIAVELSPDGRARPSSYRQTPLKATRSGIALSLLLAVLVQGYRFAVTRRN
ncbi:MAG: hypothetical protein JWM02_3221 [Frankiales bacterium]|nr:hypothetical protein [Frankiales bacterium]